MNGDAPKSSLFPLFVNLAGLRCLVVGGGVVGQRKARSLLAAGAAVRVVCLEDAPTGFEAIEWFVAPYRADFLNECVLVCAAANPTVNAQVVADARERGCWVNSATDPDDGTVLFPATFHQGPIHGAISTGGASPLVARRIAEHLGTACDAAWVAWVELLAELRPHLRAKCPDDVRRTLYQQLADPVWLERLRTTDPKEVRHAMWMLVDEASRR